VAWRSEKKDVTKEDRAGTGVEKCEPLPTEGAGNETSSSQRDAGLFNVRKQELFVFSRKYLGSLVTSRSRYCKLISSR
jgi:hypothetical protein